MDEIVGWVDADVAHARGQMLGKVSAPAGEVAKHAGWKVAERLEDCPKLCVAGTRAVAHRLVIGFGALGEDFEKREHQLFGEEGFEKFVAQVAEIEKQLGIYDLAQFTPKI